MTVYTKKDLIQKLKTGDVDAYSYSYLSIASMRRRNDKDIVLAAVNQNGHALKYASTELKNDKDIVLTAVNKAGYTLRYASTELQNDKKLILNAYCTYPEILEDIKVDNSDKIFNWLRTQPYVEYDAASRDYILNVSEQYSDAFWNPDPLILSLLENDPYPLLSYAMHIEFKYNPLVSDKITETSMDIFL